MADAESKGEITTTELLLLVAIQSIAAFAGLALAHAIFDLVLWVPSVKHRSGLGQWLAEGVAAFGLLLTIIGSRRFGIVAAAAAVAAYIFGDYGFTASTSFANPVVTLARAFPPTFTGIHLRMWRDSCWPNVSAPRPRPDCPCCSISVRRGMTRQAW